MNRIRNFVLATATALSLAAVGALPAQAVPIIFNVAGSATSIVNPSQTSTLVGTITMESTQLSGSGNYVPFQSFSITDTDLGITWDNTDSITYAVYFDAGPTTQPPLFSLFVTDSTSPAHDLFIDVAALNGQAPYKIFVPGNQYEGLVTISDQTSSVPEPISLATLGLGMAAMAFARRRRKT